MTELSCLDMEQKDAFLYFLKLLTDKEKWKNKKVFAQAIPILFH